MVGFASRSIHTIRVHPAASVFILFKPCGPGNRTCFNLREPRSSFRQAQCAGSVDSEHAIDEAAVVSPAHQSEAQTRPEVSGSMEDFHHCNRASLRASQTRP